MKLFISLKQKISRDFICGLRDMRWYLYTQAVSRPLPPLFGHGQTDCRSLHFCFEHGYKISSTNFHSFKQML